MPQPHKLLKQVTKGMTKGRQQLH